MAQSEIAWAAITALLPDNTTSEIGPQDIRDVLASAMGGYGGMVLSVTGEPATMLTVATTPVLVDVFDTITAQSSTVNTNGTISTLSATYSHTVKSDGIYRVDYWASFASSGNNQVITFKLYVDGTDSDLAKIDRSIGTGGDTGVGGFNIISAFSADEVLDVRVNIDSGTTDLTFHGAGFNVHRVG